MTDSDDAELAGPAWDRALSRTQRLIYSCLRPVLYAIVRVYFRVDVVGLQNLPPSGSYIVAPVHRSNLDAVFVQVITRRQLRFMGKDSLWRAGGPVIGWFLTAFGGFPVARGTADRASLRAARHMIERGEPLVLFPEGTRQSGPVVQPLFDGPAFLASRTGVPIIPIGIGGSEAAMGKGVKIPRPKRVAFVVGTPVLPPAHDGARVPRRVVQELTATLHERVQDLFDDAQRRAGQPVGSQSAAGEA